MERIEALETAIQNNNLIGIYSVFYTIAHGDPSFLTGKFMDTLTYVKNRNIPGLMQEFDGEEFKDSIAWDEEYWAYIASSLIDNFCEERILHLKEIGIKLYPTSKYNATEQMNRENTVKRNIGTSNNGYAGRMNSGADNGYAGRMNISTNNGYAGRMNSGADNGYPNGIISEEQKRGVRFEHLNKNRKDDGGFFHKLFGSRTRR